MLRTFQMPLVTEGISITRSTAGYWLPSLFRTELMKQKMTFEPRHEISNNVVCATSKASDQPAHTRSLISAFASRLDII